MTTVGETRKTPRLIAHGYIFVIALGVILMLSPFAIVDYYWVLKYYSWLIIGLGIVWGLTKLLYSIKFQPSKPARQARLQLWLERSYIFGMILAAILTFSGGYIGDYFWSASNHSEQFRFLGDIIAGYGWLIGIFSTVVLGLPALVFLIRADGPHGLPAYLRCKRWCAG